MNTNLAEHKHVLCVSTSGHYNEVTFVFTNLFFVTLMFEDG